MSTAIKVENVSKAYQLGEFSSGTLSRDLERWWALYRGKEDPFLKIGETNDRSVKGGSDIVWSLKDLNFEIQQGDAVGIIGKNGAGKSTLLKVLSQVTSPTTGKIKVKGRIASLLEVGTGFHPELTGRENIYLNGAILGMRKHEIAKKFDEIVDFSGVDRYIDTPVKRYSSGMYVRLAFAVAAHLESEILIVDEVLAVGDAEFQKKCLGKMGDISKGEGRTVLFVSHNMVSISNLCLNSIWLENGMVKDIDRTSLIVKNYIQRHFQNLNENLTDLTSFTGFKGEGSIRIGKVLVENDVQISREKYVKLKIQILNPYLHSGVLEVAGKITDENSNYLHYFGSKLKGKVYAIRGEGIEVELILKDFPFVPGDYFFGFELKFNSEIVYVTEEVVKIKVGEYDFYESGVNWNSGLVLIDQNWQ